VSADHRGARKFDAQVENFRTRPLDAGPYTFVAAGALTMKVGEGGRVVNVHALVATGVNTHGHREILGLDITSSEDGAGWLSCFRGLTARAWPESRCHLSDAHAGLVAAIGATLHGGSWHRCRTLYAANMMAVTPKASWGWVKAMLHSSYDQPDADADNAQFDRVVDTLSAKHPTVAGAPRGSPPRHPRVHRLPEGDLCGRSGRANPPSDSTGRSADAPTSWPSSPTAPPRSASSAPSWPKQHDE
jgi:putative transposase